jgi:hypothetical protein
MQRGSPIFLTLVALLVGATAAAAAPSRGPVAHPARLPGILVGYGTGFKVRPSSIYPTGDGSGVIGKLPSDYGNVVGARPGFLDWTVWTGGRAAATGTLWEKSCIPDCAGSPFVRYALTLTAGRVRDGHFTRMTVRFRYHGKPQTGVWCVPPGQRNWGELFDGRCA